MRQKPNQSANDPFKTLFESSRETPPDALLEKIQAIGRQPVQEIARARVYALRQALIQFLILVWFSGLVWIFRQPLQSVTSGLSNWITLRVDLLFSISVSPAHLMVGTLLFGMFMVLNFSLLEKSSGLP